MASPARPAGFSRRQILMSAAALLGAPLAGCGGGDELVARTSSGRFRGQTAAGVARWLGVPYAQAPVGPLRWRAPQPPQASPGVVEATAFGPASLQTVAGYVNWIYPQPDAMSEDCLTLNIWRPEDGDRLPVLVWLHGGAFRTGATRMPLMDGSGLAARGMVVVTVNYRLGALGLLSHPHFTDPGDGACANWQMQDMAAALRWVQENISAFGGDPRHVCLAGQSGGAMHAAMLPQNPAYRGTFQKAALFSPPSLTPPGSMTMADAALYAELLATRLGTTVPGLRDVPARTLHDAELALNATTLPPDFTSGRAFKLSPLIDGITCLGDWTRLAWPQDLPVLINYTLDEGAFWFNLRDPAQGSLLTPPPPASDAALMAALTGRLGGDAAAADAVIAAYRQAAQAEGRPAIAASLWIDAFGDQLLRNFGTRYAGRLADAGVPVRYGTYMQPVQPPGEGVPHCAELPLLFGTYPLADYRDKVGAGPVQAQLSTRMMGALASFARDAQPMLSSTVPWPLYRPGTGTAVSWGADGLGGVTLGPVPKSAQLAVWDAILGY